MQKLQCELCGGNAFRRTDDGFFQCEYCGTKYTKDQLMSVSISAQTVGGIQADVVNVYNGGASDFEIVGGVLKKYNGSATEIVIPEGVIEIAGEVFDGMQHITSVKFPASLKIIGRRAFNNCSINSLKFPEGLEKIDDDAFFRCDFLESVWLPESLTHINSYAFSGCQKLSSIKLPGHLEYIGKCAFSCTGLESIEIPASLKWINFSAFDNCRSLRSVRILGSDTVIRKGAFYGCVNLTDLQYSGSQIEESAFDQTPLWEGKCPYCGGEIKRTILGDHKCTKCKRLTTAVVLE